MKVAPTGSAPQAPTLADFEPCSVTLASETDFEGFRRAARRLLAQGVPPEAVMWFTPSSSSLFGSAAQMPADDGAHEESGDLPRDGATHGGPLAPAPPRVSAEFLSLAQTACLHDDPDRFALVYRLLWRMAREPGLKHDPLDADRVRLAHWAQAVRRDMHKMKAFVRFRPIEAPEGGTLHVAWFEPSHHIVEAVAPFFARRFTAMRWAILTPRGCAHWDGEVLGFGPPARREDAPAPDAGEALWLTYYANIFNPARLKLAMMRKEMPRKYWHNLPESVLISPLAQRAAERAGAMVEQAPTEARAGMRTLPARRSIALAQVDSLGRLREAAQQCRDCPIGAHATQAVCGEGPLAPALMFVGEQPGDAEDLQGRPFVGPAGQLFDRALGEIGLARDTLYLANAVKHFKYELRGKRRIHKTASQKEAAACSAWLEKEIELVKPRALVALGATAARSLLGRTVVIGRERGGWITRPQDGLSVLVTWHPSALLRMGDETRQSTWPQWLADLRMAAASSF